MLPPTVQTLATGGGGGGWSGLQPPPSTDAWILVLLGDRGVHSLVRYFDKCLNKLVQWPSMLAVDIV